MIFDKEFAGKIIAEMIQNIWENVHWIFIKTCSILVTYSGFKLNWVPFKRLTITLPSRAIQRPMPFNI